MIFRFFMFFFSTTAILEISSLPATTKKPAGRSIVSANENEEKLLAEENETTKNIEKYVASVPMINFEGDVVLLQFGDRLNMKTDYRHVIPQFINKIIYERNSFDVDKEVIVLKSSEDHIATKGQKKVYVVLRRNNVMGDRRLYYISYLYIKDPIPQQDGIHYIGKRKVSIEWDFWDNREAMESTGELESAFSCSSTIFTPCRSNETIDFPLPKKLKSSGNKSTADKPSSKTKDESQYNQTYIVEGGDPDKFFEFFHDLDKTSSQRGSGRSMKFHFQSMSTFGKTGVIGSESHYQGQVFNFFDTDMKVFHNMIQSVIEAGMGLVKSFNGLFGGLGTPEAKVDEVLKSLVNIQDPEAFSDNLSKTEMDELEDEVKLPSSGGLGGFINADESREAEEEGIIKKRKPKPIKGRKVTKGALGSSNSEYTPEASYVRYGWNTDSESNSENDPFVGFGACRYRKVSLEDFKNITGPLQLIRLYQTVLRTQCINKDTKLYQKMLSDGILSVDEDEMSFIINFNSPILKQEKLQQKQRISMYRALELFFFSKVYVEELSNPKSGITAPDNAPISRNVYTLGKMILKGLSSRNIIPKQHCIKVGRNLVKTLRLALSKLTEDNDAISSQDKEVNFNDRVYLISLMQYIIHSYESLLMNSNADVLKSFELFYIQNRALLEDRIGDY